VYLRNEEVLHRDIKPDNLVIDEAGYIKLTDFGVSRVKVTKNENDTSGTPAYMAPEILFKSGHSFQCDIYSLGVTLYECIFKKWPYRGSKKKDLRKEITESKIQVFPEDLPFELSDDALSFVLGVIYSIRR